jgi:pimeloyl-ACP methyl ester carboxylesterase
MPVSLAVTAPNRFLEVGGTRFAYRRFGSSAGVPLVFIQHFMGNLENFDPAISDALSAGREVILFDNAGVGGSTGAAPDTVDAMAADAARFIDGLGLATIDILGHSMGGEVAQLIAAANPDLVRRLVLVGTGPRGAGHIAAQEPYVGPLFGKREELGDDMWLPIMFSPSKESQAAGRAFLSRIHTRAEDRDLPVSLAPPRRRGRPRRWTTSATSAASPSPYSSSTGATTSSYRRSTPTTCTSTSPTPSCGSYRTPVMVPTSSTSTDSWAGSSTSSTSERATPAW